MHVKTFVLLFSLSLALKVFSQEQFKRGNFMFSFQTSYAGTKVEREEELKPVYFFTKDHLSIKRNDNFKLIEYTTFKSYNIDFALKAGYFVAKNLALGIKSSLYFEIRDSKDTIPINWNELLKIYPDLYRIRSEKQDLFTNSNRSFADFSMSLWARYYVPIQKIKSAFWLEVQLENSRVNFSKNIVDRIIFGIGYSYLISKKISLDASFNYIVNFKMYERFYYYKHTQFSVGVT